MQFNKACFSIILCVASLIVGCSSDDDFEIPDLSISETSDTTKDDSGEPEPTADLKLTVGEGYRFPLKKTISQRLVQKSAQGDIASTSKLEMTFAITIEKEEEGRRLLSLNYQRVRYTHEILGQRTSYDSLNPPADLPESLQVYHGLVGNGFKFWLGAKNRIVEVEGFDEFLKRCVRYAPAERQEVLLKHIVATQKDEGFSNFVDDSIGLLPYKVGDTGEESLVKKGEKWNKRKQIMRPLPMSIDNSYTLTHVGDDVAHVQIFGTILPVRAAQASGQTTNEIITLEQGHTFGNCVIDLKTGLPLRSRVERLLDMNVEVAGHKPYKQQKTITTTIEAFPSAKQPIMSQANTPEIGPPTSGKQTAAPVIIPTAGQQPEPEHGKGQAVVDQAVFELDN